MQRAHAQGQRSLELRERCIGNALYAWAEAVAMSAGGEVGFSRDEMGPPTPELFRRLREVRPWSPHVLATGRWTDAVASASLFRRAVMLRMPGLWLTHSP